LIYSSPKLGATLGEIKDLARVEQPLEDLHKLGTLVGATLWIDKYQQRFVVALRKWLHREVLARSIISRGLPFSAVSPFKTLGGLFRFITSFYWRHLYNPTGRYDAVSERTQMAGFPLHLIAKARQMVAITTPGTADTDYLLATELLPVAKPSFTFLASPINFPTMEEVVQYHCLSTSFVLDLSEGVLACVALVVELSYAGSVSNNLAC